MLESLDHSYKTGAVSVRIDLPEGYESEFGKIDPESIGTWLPMDSFRGRGNSSWLADKKSFKLKLEYKTDVLGMGKSRHWLLFSNAFDRSLLRNRIMMELGRRMGLHFTPRMLPVDLVINGEYMGSYMLSQSVRIEKSSVNIDKIPSDASDEAEITGGFLLALNPDSDTLPGNIFTTERGLRFLLKDPSFESDDHDTVGTPEQWAYITRYLQLTENAIFGENLRDEDGVSWTEYMDMESAAKYWWLQELCLNPDAFRSDSTYLYKPRNGKLFWGPLWDFEISMDPVTFEDTLGTVPMLWLDHLRACEPEFQEELLHTWGEMDAILDEFTEDGGVIDRYAEEIRASWEQDDSLWHDDSRKALSLDAQVAELKQFIEERRKAIEDRLNLLGEVSERPVSAPERQTASTPEVQTPPELQPDDLAGGSCGTCYWRIDSQGELLIWPADGSEGRLSAWTNAAQRPWHPYLDSIISVSFRGTVHAQTCLAMFYHCYHLKEIDLTGLDTSEVTTMRGMFAWCWNLESLDVTGLNTSAAVSMREMFLACNSLTSLDLTSFDLSNTTDLRMMFFRCYQLKHLALPTESTCAEIYMRGMFADCYALESVDLSGFDLSEPGNMRYMFANCASLTVVYVNRSWSEEPKTEKEEVFYHCSAVTEQTA